jgi:hypothetical protein
MSTREKLWQKFELLIEQERFDEADHVLKQIEPLDREAWHERLAALPTVDIPPSAEALRRLAHHSSDASTADPARRAG